jgi:predicted transcriptional regulator
MKLSVSLPDPEVEFLDALAREHNETRSATLLRAVRLLRASQLQVDYADAWLEWDESGEGTAWEGVAGDGLGS